jgi:hypothetical protein
MSWMPLIPVGRCGGRAERRHIQAHDSPLRRYSLPLRERMPSVDLNTVTFETGSWEVSPDQIDRLAVIADGMNRAIAANPSEVFLIEGHTDGVARGVGTLSVHGREVVDRALGDTAGKLRGSCNARIAQSKLLILTSS